MSLVQGMHQSADTADCVEVLLDGLNHHGEISDVECECYLKVSLDEFVSWTGVQPSSCKPGTNLSFEEEHEECEKRL